MFIFGVVNIEPVMPTVNPMPVLDGLSVLMFKSVGFNDADTVEGIERLKDQLKDESVLAFESTQGLFKELLLPFEVYEWPFNDVLTFRWSAVTPVRLGLRMMGGRTSLNTERGIRVAAKYRWVSLEDFGSVFGLGLESVLSGFGHTDDLKAGVLHHYFIPPFWASGEPYPSGLDNMPVVYAESLELRQISFPNGGHRTELLNVPNYWEPKGTNDEFVAAYVVGFPVSDSPVHILNIDSTQSYPAVVNVDTDGFVNLIGKVERSKLFGNPKTGESFWRLRVWVDMSPTEGASVNPSTGKPNLYQHILECVVPNKGYDLAVSANRDVFVEITSLVFAGVFSPMGSTSSELFERALSK